MVSLLSTETDRFDVVYKLNLLNFDEQLLGLIWYESFVRTYSNAATLHFLNQVHAGLWLARAWFLRIASVCELQYVCLCVCVCPRGYQ